MFTCTVTGPGILQRAVESINQVNDNPIRVSFWGGGGGGVGGVGHLPSLTTILPLHRPDLSNITCDNIIETGTEAHALFLHPR